MPSAAEECHEPSGKCHGISHCLESGHPVLSISPEVICKTGRMSVRVVSTFSNPKAPRPLDRGRWSLACGSGTKLLASGILNFGPCAARGHPELSPVGRDDSLRAGCFYFTVRNVWVG